MFKRIFVVIVSAVIYFAAMKVVFPQNQTTPAPDAASQNTTEVAPQNATDGSTTNTIEEEDMSSQ